MKLFRGSKTKEKRRLRTTYGKKDIPATSRVLVKISNRNARDALFSPMTTKSKSTRTFFEQYLEKGDIGKWETHSDFSHESDEDRGFDRYTSINQSPIVQVKTEKENMLINPLHRPPPERLRTARNIKASRSILNAINTDERPNYTTNFSQASVGTAGARSSKSGMLMRKGLKDRKLLVNRFSPRFVERNKQETLSPRKYQKPKRCDTPSSQKLLEPKKTARFSPESFNTQRISNGGESKRKCLKKGGGKPKIVGILKSPLQRENAFPLSRQSALRSNSDDGQKVGFRLAKEIFKMRSSSILGSPGSPSDKSEISVPAKYVYVSSDSGDMSSSTNDESLTLNSHDFNLFPMEAECYSLRSTLARRFIKGGTDCVELIHGAEKSHFDEVAASAAPVAEKVNEESKDTNSGHNEGGEQKNCDDKVCGAKQSSYDRKSSSLVEFAKRKSYMITRKLSMTKAENGSHKGLSKL